MGKILWGSLLVLAGYTLFSAAIWRLTDGFCVDHIQSHLSYSPDREIPNQNEEIIHNILKQNFYYLGKGSQCYVFESEDHDVVLKFIRYPRYRLHPLYAYITAPSFLKDIIKRKVREKELKLNRFFLSCRLAYLELREETGLIYLHLNKTQNLKQTVILYDNLKRPCPIEMDDYEFIIQKKGEQTYHTLTYLLEQGKKEEAKKALISLSIILKKCLQKGIIDTDSMIHKNAGFRNQKALILDIGGFKRCTLTNREGILFQMTRRLRCWLQEHDPELAADFEKNLWCSGPYKTSPQVKESLAFF